MIYGGKIWKIVYKCSWIFSWGKEFEFLLFSLENDEFVVEVYDYILIFKDKFVGIFCYWVFKL